MIYFRCLSIQNLIVVAAAVCVCVSLAEFRASPATVEASEHHSQWATDNEKVKIELYYESQCPGCRQMVTTSFYEAFQAEGFLDMAEVEFVPYGNAQETKTASGTYEFRCQHGPSECVYNTIEVCAMAKIDDPLVAFQYIDCIERSDDSRDPQQDFEKVAIACCELTNLPERTVSQMEECAVGLEGIQLDHEAALRTDALDPPHTYVPYLVVNGEHSDTVQDAITDSLLNYVCGAYRGPDKSPDCPATKRTSTSTSTSTSSLRAIASAGVRGDSNVCYRGDRNGPTTTTTTTQ